MRQPVPRGNKKKVEQPVIVTSNNQFTPKISERTLKKRREAKENRLNPSKHATGLDVCGIICLYSFLILCVLIGGGGIGVCAYYFNVDSNTQGWKIGGIVMGAITCIIGIILILLTIFKQARNRPWKYKKKEKLVTDDYYGNVNDDSDNDDNIQETFIENPTRKSIVIIREDSTEDKKSVSQSAIVHSPIDEGTREIATSPLPNLSTIPTQFKTLTSDLIFCPGCNRTHPSSHQCMYATRIANGFSAPFRPVPHASKTDSIAIQTDDDGRKQKSKKPHTLIDRSLKYSTTTETQTNVTANPKSNITESVILRRVPIPTAKVVVQQPTTKVMIVKVPNVAGQLIIQPKNESIDEQK